MYSTDLEEDGADQFDIDESDDEDELEDALRVDTSLEDHDLYHDDDDDGGDGNGNGNEKFSSVPSHKRLRQTKSWLYLPCLLLSFRRTLTLTKRGKPRRTKSTTGVDGSKWRLCH